MSCFLTVHLTQVLAAKDTLWGILADLTWLSVQATPVASIIPQLSLTEVALHWKQTQSGITWKRMETRQSRPVGEA